MNLSFTPSPCCHSATRRICTCTSRALRVTVPLRRSKLLRCLRQPVFPRSHPSRSSLLFTHPTHPILLQRMPRGSLAPMVASRLPPLSMNLSSLLPLPRPPCRFKTSILLLSRHPLHVGHPHLLIYLFSERFLTDASHSIARVLLPPLFHSALRRRSVHISLWAREEVNARDHQVPVAFHLGQGVVRAPLLDLASRSFENLAGT